MKYRFLFVALAIALPAVAEPRLARRTNFGCVSLRDAGDLLVINSQRNTDAMLELVRAGRCAQVQASGGFEPRELLVLERAERSDGSAFLRVRLYMKKPTIGTREKPDQIDLWFPEGDVRGSYPPVPTRSFEEATR